MQNVTRKTLRFAQRRSSHSAMFAFVIICLTAAHALAAPVGTEQKSNPPAAALPGDFLFSSDALYPFRDAYALAPYGYPQAHVLLSVEHPHLRQPRPGANPPHEDFAVDIRLYNDSGDQHRFYNLYWNPLIPEPGRLALYDAQKHYVCDLLDRMGGSRATIGTWAWADVPASGYVGKILYVSLPYPSYKVISAGTYYLQVIYLPRVVQPFSEASTFDDSDHTELFRSNTVTITVLGHAATKPAKFISTR